MVQLSASAAREVPLRARANSTTWFPTKRKCASIAGSAHLPCSNSPLFDLIATPSGVGQALGALAMGATSASYMAVAPAAMTSPSKAWRDLSCHARVLVLVVRVELGDGEPDIWRQCQIPRSLAPNEVQVLQAAFDWEDTHLHRFTTDEPFAALRSVEGELPSKTCPDGGNMPLDIEARNTHGCSAEKQKTPAGHQ